jgi:hypothetical protein
MQFSISFLLRALFFAGPCRSEFEDKANDEFCKLEHEVVVDGVRVSLGVWSFILTAGIRAGEVSFKLCSPGSVERVHSFSLIRENCSIECLESDTTS